MADASYFPEHLRAEDESEQHWTEAVDREADALFRTLSESDIRDRQLICREQTRLAFDQNKDVALLDLQRNSEALAREMMRRLG